MSIGQHQRIQLNLLLTSMVAGAMGAPLLGPVRETLQDKANLSRAELGLWIMVVGVAGAGAGVVASVVQHRWYRTTLFRVGLAALALACGLLVVFKPEPGWTLAGLAGAWFLIWASRPMTGVGNGMFTDIWHASPHTGVILLHTVNAFGKVLAPLVVLVVGTRLQLNAVVYTVLLGLLAVDAIFWPTESVRQLRQREHDQIDPLRKRLPHDVGVWLCAMQFAFIAGSEAGATAILGSLVLLLRPAPVTWINSGNWATVVIAVMLTGIVVGRVALTIGSRWMGERAIIGLCVACGVFAAPGALSEQAAVYLPALLVTGVCFSATWPAFFALAARTYPADKTFLATAGSFFTALGVSACIYVSSGIGNVSARLPLAFVASAAVMLPFGLFLFASPWGRRLGRSRGDG